MSRLTRIALILALAAATTSGCFAPICTPGMTTGCIVAMGDHALLGR